MGLHTNESNALDTLSGLPEPWMGSPFTLFSGLLTATLFSRNINQIASRNS